MDTALPASRAQRRTEGKAARTHAPLSSLAELDRSGRDPLGILNRQNETRDPDLVPLRIERMAESPFAFYRGTAAIMAADLASTPNSGIRVASCGDAHVSNFGFYASPHRRLVFDLNDFDEAAWAPWDWDVKRLVTSLVIGGRSTGRDDGVIERAARGAVDAYLGSIRRASGMSPTERYFTHFDLDESRKLLSPAARRAIKSATAQARKRTGERAVRRLTELRDDGRRRIVLREPTTLPVDPLITGRVHGLLDDYRRSASQDVWLLFEHFTAVDIARRVVGVGSVGTRCFLVLFQDGDGNALLMQPKQAGRSVLEEYGGMPQPPALAQHIDTWGEGARVVAMQRILQALSDPFLGHVRGPERDYYVRQFHDMKGGIELEELDDEAFHTYGQACAAVLARAHAQSPAAGLIPGYAGGGSKLTDALVEWAYAYADLSRTDWEAFAAATMG